jgi:hypothetical protein
MALTAALVNGADVVCGAIVLELLFNTAASISVIIRRFRRVLSPSGLMFHDVYMFGMTTSINLKRPK